MSLATAPNASRRLPGQPGGQSGRIRTIRAALARRRGLREFLFIALIYAMYDGSRFVVAGKESTAFSHAVGVLDIEDKLHFGWEKALNEIVSAHALLAVPADYIYATLHYVVTPIVLVWMWRLHREHYARARTTLMVATVIGLVGFSLLPVAPPRMLPGFVDTMAQYASAGWWGEQASAPRGVGSFTNQFAAMPSLHVGWALWAGWQLVVHGRHRVTRWFGVFYPALITVVVMATGNHYLLDAVAGVAVVLLAMVAVRGVAALRPRRVIDLTAHEAPMSEPADGPAAHEAPIPSQGARVD
jgi:hypothetical protein